MIGKIENPLFFLTCATGTIAITNRALSVEPFGLGVFAKSTKPLDLEIEKEIQSQNAKALDTGIPERTLPISRPTCHSRALVAHIRKYDTPTDHDGITKRPFII